MRSIFEIHPIGALDPPDEIRNGTAEPREISQPLRLFELNASLLITEFGRVNEDIAMLAHVLFTLQTGRSTDDARSLLLSLRLVRGLVTKVLGQNNASEEQMALLLKRLADRAAQDL